MDSTVDLQSIRERLEAELDSLEKSIEAKTNAPNEGRNPDRSDLAQSYTSRERDIALLSVERQHLEQVRAALERLDDGVYGYCTNCGDPIPFERLEILPHATLCVSCQERLEH